MKTILLVYLLLANLAAFALMGADKRRAQRCRWRIPEKTLLLSAILGGSPGAILGMYLFRHKTKHLQFVLGMPAVLVLQLVLAFWLKSRFQV